MKRLLLAVLLGMLILSVTARPAEGVLRAIVTGC